MKLLCAEPTADGLLDLAYRATKAGHDVRYHCGSYNPEKAPIGRGLVERVPDFRPSMRWADLVVVGGNGKWVQELDKWRAMGVPIIGGGMEAAKLELDRMVGMKAFQRAGIAVPPYRHCQSLRDAIAYVEKRGEGCAVKPCGDVADKSTSVVGKTAPEVLWRLERWLKEGKSFPGGLLVQDRVEGTEFAVGAWIGPGGFAVGWEENFEEKRVYAGGLGPNCYSADTEVLTQTGWKLWPEVSPRDTLATLLQNGVIHYERPERLVSYDFDGEMVAWQSNRVDLLVTPDHSMYVADRDTIRAGEPEFFHATAEKIAENRTEKKFAVLRTARWTGTSADWRCKPAYARLLGMYLADGNCKKRSIEFGNCPLHKEKLIREAAIAAGYVAHRYGNSVYINSADLANDWRHFPHAIEKRAPPEIMNGPIETIVAFLDGLALDATTTGNRVYTTASRGMADDIQIMLMRIGMAGYIRERDRRDEPDRMLKGHVIRGSLSWDVGVSSQALAWLRPQYCRRVPYSGKVYCATVSSHTLFVRRNGKACWSGNCGESGTVMRLVRKSKLASSVLAPFEDYLVHTGYAGNIDVNCIVSDADPYPLEWTSRLGWPAFNIEVALHESDPVEFLYGVATGSKPPLRKMDEVAVGVVLALPPYPYGHEKPEEVVGVPIWGVTPRMEDQLHYCNVMKTGDQLATAGSYVLVATGVAETVVAARNQAHRALERLTIPVSPFWRNDIGLRLRRQLDDLQGHGFAAGMQYSA